MTSKGEGGGGGGGVCGELNLYSVWTPPTMEKNRIGFALQYSQDVRLDAWGMIEGRGQLHLFFGLYYEVRYVSGRYLSFKKVWMISLSCPLSLITRMSTLPK
jgi:hypothetical protein